MTLHGASQHHSLQAKFDIFEGENVVFEGLAVNINFGWPPPVQLWNQVWRKRKINFKVEVVINGRKLCKIPLAVGLWYIKVFNVIKLKARAPSRMYILYMHWFFPRCLLNMLATGSQYLVSALLSGDTRENFWIWRHHESFVLLSRWTVKKRFHNFTWLHTSLTFFRGGFNIFHQNFLQGWNKSNIITFYLYFIT